MGSACNKSATYYSKLTVFRTQSGHSSHLVIKPDVLFIWARLGTFVKRQSRSQAHQNKN